MEKIRLKKIEKILPKYSWIPIIMFFVVNMITYYGTRFIAHNFVHHDITVWVDNKIPFVSAMIAIYLLAFIQWYVGFFIAARESREVCYIIFTAEIIAKSVCFLFYVLYPTTMVRPEIEVNNIFDYMTSLIYKIDTPVNLFPSIHCLESYIILRSVFYLKKVSNQYRIVTIVMSFLVFLSVVTVKQHVVADIIGAVVVGEFGMILSRFIIWRRFLPQKKAGRMTTKHPVNKI